MLSVGWAPEPNWTYGEEKDLLPLPGIEPLLLGRSAYSLAAIPTELDMIVWFIWSSYRFASVAHVIQC
jgi:hypothetical protein